MILVSVTLTAAAVEQQLDELGAGALLRLERGDAQAGPFSEFATQTLASGVQVYDIWDPEGDEDSWYRYRFSEADGDDPTAYSSAFQAGEQAYATRTDLLATFRQPTTDTRALERMTTVLAEVSRDLSRLVGYSFFRQPTSGTEDVVFDGNGRDLLHVHGTAPRVGVVSVTTLSVRFGPDDAWRDLDADEWQLEGDPGGLHTLPDDPYFHVRLLSHSRYPTFPKGTATVKLGDAVFGWPTIPVDLRAATVAFARQRLAADPSVPGGPLGPDEYGQVVAPDRYPRAVFDFLASERDRHECWT